MRLLAGFALVPLAFLANCAFRDYGDRGVSGPRETIREAHTVERSALGTSERVSVDVEIGAGELRVDGGSKEMLESEFVYNVPEWKPEVRFSQSGFRGLLTVKQGGKSAGMGNVKNDWHLTLGDKIPMDFSLKCGAGDNRLDLGKLDLRDVQVQIGAGRVELDLRGDPVHDYTVSVHGGVGEAVLHLPRDAGILAEASGGIGEIQVDGLDKSGSEWRNRNYGKAKANIRVDVKGGIGKIEIDAR